MELIVKNLKGHYKEVTLGPLFKLIEAILELLVPLVMADIIDIGIAKRDSMYIWQRGGLLLILAIAGIVCSLICQYYAAVAAGHFGKKLRNQLYTHVMSLSNSEAEKFGAGKLITLVTNDAYQIQHGINMVIRLGSRVPFLVIGSIVMALMLNLKIGLVFIVTAPAISIVLYLIMKRTLPQYGNLQSKQDNLSRLSRENLSGVRVIRAFHRQNAEKEDFDTASNSLTELMMRIGKISALLNPLTGLIINIAIIIIVWLGAEYTYQGISNPGQIIALVSYMNTTVLALTVAANLIIAFTRAIASTKRVEAVLNTEPSIKDGQGAQPYRDAPVLEFSNVSFSYSECGQNAIEGISHQINRGETLGIIGGTGSGKTTLANLIIRAFDCTSGEVKFAGVDVREYTLSGLRSKIGFVPQKTALFTGSIRYNMQMGNPIATDEEIWSALNVAQAEDFVRAMPSGLDTLIDEGGKNLSGGQRQRLTIARAMVRKPDLLILDDSSSALDYATDAALRKALSSQTQNMSVVIISQRASSIKNADCILVLDDGRLAGKGTHNELVNSSEVYQEICHTQGLLEKEVG